MAVFTLTLCFNIGPPRLQLKVLLVTGRAFFFPARVETDLHRLFGVATLLPGLEGL